MMRRQRWSPNWANMDSTWCRWLEKGELVGCLMEKEIAHLLEDDVTGKMHRQGATLLLEKPYLEISPWTLWKKRSWLLLLFVAEACHFSSSVIQHFEEALESAIALAFIPLLIGTGGNSGTQITSTRSVPWRFGKYACAIWAGDS